jgi:predicted permease
MFKFLRRLGRATLGRRRFDADLERELAFHLDMEAERGERAGVAPAAARRAASLGFGPLLKVRDEVLDARGISFWDSLLQDVRVGLRVIRRSPGHALAASAVLALGIGANTAVFSVIDGVLLKPLPFREGGQLTLLEQSAPAARAGRVGVSIPEYQAYRARLRSLRDLVEYHSMAFTLLQGGEPDRVDTGVVSPNFFDVLGVPPLVGRTFVDADDGHGAEPVLVLSHAYWQQKYGGDPRVVGRIVKMNNRPHTIVGVLPDIPQFPRENDVYMPTSACPFRARADTARPQGHRSFGALQVFGRLADGATAESASAEIATLAATYPRDHPDDYRNLASLTGRARPLRDSLVGSARPLLWTLVATATLVLLIACANVANLAVARLARRDRELAMRTALGATRWRLARQLLTESVLIATAGGALGLVFAWSMHGVLVEFVGRFTPRSTQILLDGRVLAFSAAVAGLTGIVFGTAPALAARGTLAQSVRAGVREVGDTARRRRLQSSLVVAQVGVSFVLLVGAALLLQSAHRLSRVALGYETSGVMTASIYGNFTTMSTPDDAIRIHRAVLERLRSSPGIVSAAVTSSVPLSDIQPGQQGIRIEGDASERGEPVPADTNVASDGYFETLRVPLLAGRTFRPGDTVETPLVAVINQSMARYWNGRDPVGSRIAVEGDAPRRWYTVVGVVGDFRLYGAERAVEPQYYLTYLQAGSAGRVLARTARDPRGAIEAIRAAVRAADAATPVEEFLTLEQLRSGRLEGPRLIATLLAVFAAVALSITLAGLVGVIATSLSQRTRELSVRLVLGASRASILKLVFADGVGLVGLGLSAGLVGAYTFGRLMGAFLFDTQPMDATLYLVAAFVFVLASAVASLSPARRSLSVDPLVALKAD